MGLLSVQVALFSFIFLKFVECFADEKQGMILAPESVVKGGWVLVESVRASRGT